MMVITSCFSITYLRPLWNGSRHTQKLLAIQSDKEFRVIGRDCLPYQNSSNITTNASSGQLQVFMVIAMLRSDEEETSKLSEQGQKEAGSNGQPVHFVACVAKTNHKCIVRFLASKENSRAETLRGRQSAHQWHVHGCELHNTENNTGPRWWKFRFLRRLVLYWT